MCTTSGLPDADAIINGVTPSPFGASASALLSSSM